MEERHDEIGTVRWFGERWNPHLHPDAHVGLPDAECATCGFWFTEGDRGIGIPHAVLGTVVGFYWWHLDCWLTLMGVVNA